MRFADDVRRKVTVSWRKSRAGSVVALTVDGWGGPDESKQMSIRTVQGFVLLRVQGRTVAFLCLLLPRVAFLCLLFRVCTPTFTS